MALLCRTLTSSSQSVTVHCTYLCVHIINERVAGTQAVLGRTKATMLECAVAWHAHVSITLVY